MTKKPIFFRKAKTKGSFLIWSENVDVDRYGRLSRPKLKKNSKKENQKKKRKEK